MHSPLDHAPSDRPQEVQYLARSELTTARHQGQWSAGPGCTADTAVGGPPLDPGPDALVGLTEAAATGGRASSPERGRFTVAYWLPVGPVVSSAHHDVQTPS